MRGFRVSRCQHNQDKKFTCVNFYVERLSGEQVSALYTEFKKCGQPHYVERLSGEQVSALPAGRLVLLIISTALHAERLSGRCEISTLRVFSHLAALVYLFNY